MTTAMRLASLFLLFGLARAGNAGTEVVNGGSGIVCRDATGQIQSAEVLDLYEARVLHGITIDLGGPTDSVDDKINIALNRLARISPNRANRYRAQVQEFFNATHFVPGVDLVLIPDAHPTVIPAGCNIEQFAIQKAPTFPQQKYFTVSKDIWDRLDNSNKAALMLHEIIYAEARGYGHENSIYVRYLNGAIASPDQLNKYQTHRQIYEFMFLIKFPTTDFYGLEYWLTNGSTDFASNGNLIRGQVFGGQLFQLKGQTVTISNIEFFDDGSVHTVSLDSVENNFYNDPELNLKLTGSITFFPSGKLEKGFADPFTHPQSGVMYSGSVSYSSNGTLLNSSIAQETLNGANFEMSQMLKGCTADVAPDGFPKKLSCTQGPVGRVHMGPTDQCEFYNWNNLPFEIDVNHRLRNPLEVGGCNFTFGKNSNGKRVEVRKLAIGANGGIEFIQAEPANSDPGNVGTRVPIGPLYVRVAASYLTPLPGSPDPRFLNVRLFDQPGTRIVREVVLGEDVELPDTNGVWLEYLANSHLVLNESGQVVYSQPVAAPKKIKKEM